MVPSLAQDENWVANKDKEDLVSQLGAGRLDPGTVMMLKKNEHRFPFVLLKVGKILLTS